MANLVQLGRMGSLVLEDSRASLVRRVMKGLGVSLAHPGPSGCRVYPDLQARREKPVMLVKWVLLGPQDQEGHLGPRERMAHKDRQVELATLDPWEKRENLEKLENLACQGMGDHRVPKEREEKRGKLVPLELQGPPDPRALPAMTAPKAAPVLLASLVIQDLQENLAHLARTVLQEIKEMMVNLARLVPLDRRENRDLQDHQEKEVHLGQQVLKAGKERKGPRASLAWKALLGKPDLSALRGLQENPVQTDSEEFLAPLGSKGFRDPQALMDLPAPWDHRVYQA